MDASSPALVQEADNVHLLDLTTDILRVRTDSISSRVERPTSRGQFGGANPLVPNCERWHFTQPADTVSDSISCQAHRMCISLG